MQGGTLNNATSLKYGLGSLIYRPSYTDWTLEKY
jgi:hypothetical protein